MRYFKNCQSFRNAKYLPAADQAYVHHSLLNYTPLTISQRHYLITLLLLILVAYKKRIFAVITRSFNGFDLLDTLQNPLNASR